MKMIYFSAGFTCADFGFSFDVSAVLGVVLGLGDEVPCE